MKTKNSIDLVPPLPTALLISTYQGSQNKEACLEHLEELELLAKTYGIITLHKEACPIRQFEAATFIGTGKLEECIQIARALQVSLIIFDDEISPAQQRNLEKKFAVPVVDRTEIILGVFAQRARTKEAKLQIELAKVKYEAPRLKRMWTHLSRQTGTGGGGYLKGEGEKQIELDRRILKRRIEQLQKELEVVRAQRRTQRRARMRSQIPVFALVGYTNVGKSTLLNALTGAGIFVEDKLFATLDTTTRKFALSHNQEILLVDTVGFIRKLPHLLIAAFKSTLEEALEADFLLHLIDISHPMAEEQAATTYEVLKELGANPKSILTVINKIDRCCSLSLLNKIRMSYPKNVQISALTGEGLEELKKMIQKELKNQTEILELQVPQSEYRIVSFLKVNGHILEQSYEGDFIDLKVEVPKNLVHEFASYQKSVRVKEGLV